MIKPRPKANTTKYPGGTNGGREIMLIPKPGGPDPIPMMGPIRFKGNTM
jgi:hypothetical protein